MSRRPHSTILRQESENGVAGRHGHVGPSVSIQIGDDRSPSAAVRQSEAEGSIAGAEAKASIYEQVLVAVPV